MTAQKKEKDKEKYSNGHNPLLNGVNVKHAISGETTCYITGHKSELNMFRVMNATGVKSEPTKYYYTYPEQYEKYKGFLLDTRLKNDWLKRTVGSEV